MTIAIYNKSLPAGELRVDITRSDTPPEALFTFAARQNPRRAFLFLSRILGKHLPVTPSIMQESHVRLALKIPPLPGPVLFIGMAETATGLGQGVFEAWKRQNPLAEGLFIQTTRYRAQKAKALRFEESHSHASQIFLHIPQDESLSQIFYRARALVLVDDEISTGNTFVNLSKTCFEHCPLIKHVHIASITDFLGQARRALPQRILGKVSFGSLLEGGWSFTATNSIQNSTLPNSALPAQAKRGNEPVLADGGFGRLGKTSELKLPDKLIEKLACRLAPEQQVLVLGTGEFMHAAFVLGRSLSLCSQAQVHIQSTTRSPILRWGAIEEVETFEDNYGEGVPNYLYNINREVYDHIFLCHETPPTPALLDLSARLKAYPLHFLSENIIEESALC